MDIVDKLFETYVGKGVNPADYPHAVVVCRDAGAYSIVNCNTALYTNTVVNNMCKVLTREEICSADPENKYITGKELLKDVQCVLVFHEPKELFMEGELFSVSDFFSYCCFADKYGLDLVDICRDYDKIAWLARIREQQKDIWRANEILLCNVEQKLYNKPKFPAGQTMGVPGTYPVGSSEVPKQVALSAVSTPPFLEPVEFAELVDILSRACATDFLCKLIVVLMASIEYCHHVLNNPAVILRVRDLPVFPSCMYYAGRILYLEELAMYLGKRAAGRFIIGYDAVHALPVINAPLASSPYLFTNAKDISLSSALTLPCELVGQRGLYSLEEFKQRLELYSEGSLRCIEWDLPNARTCLNGSAIAACAIKTPLESVCKNTESYFAEYYPAKQFRQIQVEKKRDTTCLFTYTDTDTDTDSDSDNVDVGTPADGIVHEISNSDVDLMVACALEDFDNVAKLHHEAIERAVGRELQLEYVKTENKHKYVIKGLRRDIDIFHVDDIPGVIVKYHLGCVRAWYDGSTIWCFPSFITAAETGINMDIRWTSNRKDVRDIVLKYFQRGFGTLINPSDRVNLLQYISTSNDWPQFRPPQQGNWRINNYWAQPLYHDALKEMFNPSASRYGIHKYLNSDQNNIKLPAIIHVRGAKRPDFKGKGRGFIVLPAECRSIARHL